MLLIKRFVHKSKKLGFGAISLLGVLVLLATLVTGLWVSEAFFKAMLLTGSLFWALTASFTSRWRDEKFWMIVALLFILHLVAIGAIMNRIATMNLYSLLIIGFTEGAIMFVVLFLMGQYSDNS